MRLAGKALKKIPAFIVNGILPSVTFKPPEWSLKGILFSVDALLIYKPDECWFRALLAFRPLAVRTNMKGIKVGDRVVPLSPFMLTNVATHSIALIEKLALLDSLQDDNCEGKIR